MDKNCIKENTKINKFNCFILIFLGLCGIIDAKKKQLPCVLLWIGFIGICFLTIIEITSGSRSVWDSIGGVLVGLFLILFSKITSEQIGLGDGIIFIITGIGIGMISNFILLVNSLFLTCIISILLLALKKVNRKTTLPFTPFIFCSFILEWIFKLI